ncbi:MAG: alpha/beta fold hydrolase, partial [Acidimicrobiia bacterium]|nr:alpha/beta fold hydrolase [Acidimicrobiia bacterium]
MRALAAAVVAIMVLTACSSDESAPTTTTATTLSTGTTTSTTLGDGTGPVTLTTTDGLLLEGTVAGEGDEWVVLAHMRPADMTSWEPFARELADAGFRSLAFNFRGYENSEGSGFAVDIDTVAAVEFALASGAEAVWIIGASMGGTGALAAAAEVPGIKGVVTLSAPLVFEGVDGLAVARAAGVPVLPIAAAGDDPYAAY